MYIENKLKTAEIRESQNSSHFVISFIVLDECCAMNICSSVVVKNNIIHKLYLN